MIDNYHLRNIVTAFDLTYVESPFPTLLFYLVKISRLCYDQGSFGSRSERYERAITFYRLCIYCSCFGRRCDAQQKKTDFDLPTRMA